MIFLQHLRLIDLNQSCGTLILKYILEIQKLVIKKRWKKDVKFMKHRKYMVFLIIDPNNNPNKEHIIIVISVVKKQIRKSVVKHSLVQIVEKSKEMYEV